MLCFILGWPLEWVPIVVIIVPIFLPILQALKVDMVWFSILLAVTLQTCWLSPPVALSAYYLKGIMPSWDLADIYKGMLPFMALQWIAVIILYFFPQIILVLAEHDVRDAIGAHHNHEGGDDHGTQKISDRRRGPRGRRRRRARRSRRRRASQFRWKLQSANPAGTPHMTLLNSFATNVDKMSERAPEDRGADQRRDRQADEILDAVNKGVVDSGQWWTHYATGKHPAGGLFSAPLGGSGSGLDQMGQLAWYMRGGGRDALPRVLPEDAQGRRDAVPLRARRARSASAGSRSRSRRWPSSPSCASASPRACRATC